MWNRAISAFAVIAVTGVAQAAPSVTASATAGATGLTLDGEGTSQTRIVKVADIAASTDNLLGFTVTISSGQLVSQSGDTPIAFQVALVLDGAPPPSSLAFLTPSGGVLTWVKALAGSAQRDLYIRYRAADLQDPGSYAAQVSLSIIDN